MHYYAAIERFDPGNGERWVGFTRWLGRTDLKRVITLDPALCPPVVHPESASDWQFIAKEEFMIDFFTNLEFVRQRAVGHRPSVLVAVARDPSTEEVRDFSSIGFEFAGFDVVDAQFTASSLFNRHFSSLNDFSKLSPESGLIRSRERAFRLRDAVRRRYPDREEARCHVWAIWQFTGSASNGA